MESATFIGGFWVTEGFLGGLVVKNLPAMQKTWVQILGQEDPLEKGMAAHSSILAWRIPWTEEPGRLSPWGCKELDTTERLILTNFGSQNISPKWGQNVILPNLFS